MLRQMQNQSEEFAPHTNDPQRSVGLSIFIMKYRRRMPIIDYWKIKPLSLPKAKEYLEDLNNLRFSNSGLLAEVNPFFFINEACQLLANSVKLFELGYFDCAFYSVRQAIELSLSGLYLFSNPDKIYGWKNLDKGFELRTIVPELRVGKEEFAEIKELFSDFFEKLEKEKKLLNKYVHKQGYKSLYYHYNSFNAHGKPKRIALLTKDYEIILHDTIIAVALYRLVIDPYPVLMLNDDIVVRMPDLIAESFSKSFIEKYISYEYVERYKKSRLYKGYYDYFKKLPLQNEAVYGLIHWQLFERKDCNLIKEQCNLLSLYDMEAVDLFMLSPKIGSIIIDGCINYSSETKLQDTSLTIGEAYYAEIFEGQKDYNVVYNGDYISRFPLNGCMTYLKHCDVFAKEEIDKIHALCDHYTKLFTEANDYLKFLMDNVLLTKDKV